MNINLIIGITLPFLGTALGSAMVFFMKGELGLKVNRALEGFASGVMVAASIWSLLIPAMDQSSEMGRLSFLPAAVGFWLGILFLLLLDHIIPHLHMDSNQPEGAVISLPRHGKGESKMKAFRGGALSGLVEPAGTVLTILAAGLIVPILPYLLGFASGAMMYVVVEELIPEMSAGEHLDRVTVLFVFGFTLMMALDVALG